MNYLTKILFISLLIGFQTSDSQSDSQATNRSLNRNKGTIDKQFEYVITKSYTYNSNSTGKVYKNVEFYWLTELKASVIDSLNAVHLRLDKTKEIAKNQANEIKELKGSLTSTKKTLNATKTKKNSISLFGLQMSKTVYSIVLWISIVGLFALFLMFFIKFKTGNYYTKEAKQKLHNVEIELEDHRRISIEREQKVRRQLQDEINKNTMTKKTNKNK
jgi:tetrahydromethanopterin S-methyltransferase subunit B